MGREVRRVPSDWQHPRASDGNYKPLYEGDALALLREWIAGYEQWDAAERGYTFSEYEGSPPDPDDYMPAWPERERTHWQMYETCTEGTPISPVCADPESLASWLATHGASALGGQTATYEQWHAMIVGPGSAPSGVLHVGGARAGQIDSGVAAVAERDR